MIFLLQTALINANALKTEVKNGTETQVTVYGKQFRLSTIVVLSVCSVVFICCCPLAIITIISFLPGVKKKICGIDDEIYPIP